MEGRSRTTAGSLQGPGCCLLCSLLAHSPTFAGEVNESERHLNPPPGSTPALPSRLLLPRRLLIFSHSDPLICLPKPSLLQETLAAAQLWATTGPESSRSGFPSLCPKCPLKSTTLPIPVPHAGPRPWKANSMSYREGGSHVLRPRESKTNTSAVAGTSRNAHK